MIAVGAKRPPVCPDPSVVAHDKDVEMIRITGDDRRWSLLGEDTSGQVVGIVGNREPAVPMIAVGAKRPPVCPDPSIVAHDKDVEMIRITGDDRRWSLLGENTPGQVVGIVGNREPAVPIIAVGAKRPPVCPDPSIVTHNKDVEMIRITGDDRRWSSAWRRYSWSGRWDRR